jgi:hypothetical protein
LQRFLQINIDGHILLDGREAVSAGESDKLLSANFVVQVITTVSRLGFLVKARIFDSGSQTWSEIGQRSFGDQPLPKLESLIANETIPPILIRILEIAQPSDRGVLFADCLAPASQDDLAMQAGRILSHTYPNKLKSNPTLKTAFSVVPLVNTTLNQFFTWWCVELSPQRRGMLRDNTLTISGSIENIKLSPTSPSQLYVSIMAKKLDHVLTSDLVPLDLTDTPTTAKNIDKAIEELANGL